MTDSVREEIYQFFWKPYSIRNYENLPYLKSTDEQDCHNATNRILEIFEKRIDELEFWYNKKMIIEIEPKVVFEDIKEILK